MPNVGRLGAETLEDARNSFRVLSSVLPRLDYVNFSSPPVPYQPEIAWSGTQITAKNVRNATYAKRGHMWIRVDLWAELTVTGTGKTISFELPFPPIDSFRFPFYGRLINNSVSEIAQVFVDGEGSSTVSIRRSVSGNFTAGDVEFMVAGEYPASYASL